MVTKRQFWDMKTHVPQTKRAAAACYRGAAKWLDENPSRWIRGTYQREVNGLDCYCASGVLNHLYSWFGSSAAEHYALGDCIEFYNDFKCSSARDAAAALRAVARGLERGAPL